MAINLPAEWYEWADRVAYYWEDMGASPDVAQQFALLWGLASVYGYKPRITSVFRDPAKQDAMRARWDAGDRTGLRARPAENSKHSKTTWLGNPAAEAMDMPSSNDQAVAQLAKDIGLGAGQYFRKPDPGHYYLTG